MHNFKCIKVLLNVLQYNLTLLLKPYVFSLNSSERKRQFELFADRCIVVFQLKHRETDF
jgi:hypothetical protein